MSVSTTFDMTAANAALKELYDGQSIENEVYADNPLLALVKKDEKFVGKYRPQPIIVGVSQGRSATFATAQANQTAATVDSFLLTRKKDYSIATIDGETMMAATEDKGAFLDGTKLVIDAAIQSATLSLASSIFRSGTGSIGKVSAISSGVITLVNANDVTQFEVNQVLRASSTDGGTARDAKGYVIAVDRSAGTVTVASSGFGGSAGTPTGWTANDFVSVDGDLNHKVSGLLAWLPTSAPTSGDSFYGVDRSPDPTRLAGVRYDGSSQSVEEAFIDASLRLSREGGKPDVVMTNFATYSALAKELGTKAQYVDVKGPAEISFKGIALNGANSTMKVIPDRSCPGLTSFMLTLKTWTLYSLGKAPQILEHDGNMLLRTATADAAEVRVGYYGNLGCSAPGWNAVVTTSV